MVIHRYMTANRGARLVAHIFSPELAPGEKLNDNTPGTASLASRETPGEMWGFPRDLADGVPYHIWKARVEQDGFTFGNDCDVK